MLLLDWLADHRRSSLIVFRAAMQISTHEGVKAVGGLEALRLVREDSLEVALRDMQVPRKSRWVTRRALGEHPEASAYHTAVVSRLG